MRGRGPIENVISLSVDSATNAVFGERERCN